MLKSITTLLVNLLIATPLMAQEVNIYSSRQPQLIDPILAAFTEQTGIKTNVVFLKSGMLERLKAEGRRSPADLVLTTDIANLTAVADAGLTQPVASDVINANVPASYREADGNWFGLTMRARIAYTSKDRVAKWELTSFEDLADPKWAGRICIRSGLHNYNIALLSAMIAHHGETDAEAWLSGVKANLARKPQGNDRAQIKAVWAGECDVAIGNTYYMGKMLADPEQVAWAESVNLIFPTIGDNGAHINVSGMAMTASAPNKVEALMLMEFLTSDKAQEIYAELNYEYPLLADVPVSELVKSWGEFTADDTPLTDIAQFRGDALKMVNTVNFDE
ncbi:MAG: Fe(3+) ABC transporter substrate-binding protein [Paracoccaceae bacterium]|jgi:iron(III) transport system substrate-binding protein